MGIDRGRLELLAGPTGEVSPVALQFGDALGHHDGDVAPLVLVAIETIPGTPRPSGRFNVRLLDQHGHDRLMGMGLQREPARHQRTIVSAGKDQHPVIFPGEQFTMVLTGNTTPGATVAVALYYGNAKIQNEDTDGRNDH